ncbi:MAG: class II fructose-bisphosphate aldolase [Negativicutes bacterium]|nr:class II fructose-bisphosphate aldolase [Negativicutes bacterium]
MTDEFAAKTRVDVLAVCYNRRQEGERREIIDDLPQIRELAARMDRPLSLHMNAKRSRAEYRQIIGSGIRKINIPTEMSVAAVDAIKKELADKPNVNLVNLMSVVRRGVKNIARQYMICLDCIPRGKKQT